MLFSVKSLYTKLAPYFVHGLRKRPTTKCMRVCVCKIHKPREDALFTRKKGKKQLQRVNFSHGFLEKVVPRQPYQRVQWVLHETSAAPVYFDPNAREVGCVYRPNFRPEYCLNLLFVTNWIPEERERREKKITIVPRRRNLGASDNKVSR